MKKIIFILTSISTLLFSGPIYLFTGYDGASSRYAEILQSFWKFDYKYPHRNCWYEFHNGSIPYNAVGYVYSNSTGYRYVVEWYDNIHCTYYKIPWGFVKAVSNPCGEHQEWNEYTQSCDDLCEAPKFKVAIPNINSESDCINVYGYYETEWLQCNQTCYGKRDCDRPPNIRGLYYLFFSPESCQVDDFFNDVYHVVGTSLVYDETCHKCYGKCREGYYYDSGFHSCEPYDGCGTYMTYNAITTTCISKSEINSPYGVYDGHPFIHKGGVYDYDDSVPPIDVPDLPHPAKPGEIIIVFDQPTIVPPLEPCEDPKRQICKVIPLKKIGDVPEINQCPDGLIWDERVQACVKYKLDPRILTPDMGGKSNPVISIQDGLGYMIMKPNNKSLVELKEWNSELKKKAKELEEIYGNDRFTEIPVKSLIDDNKIKRETEEHKNFIFGKFGK